MAASSGFSDEEGGMLTDINVTPLVDVVLVLLIVFMITMPTIIGSTPIKVDLPETGTVQIDKVESLPIDLTLKRGTGGELVLYLGDRPTNEEQIKAMLATKKKVEDQPVSLSADKDIAYGDVVKVMDMLASMNLHKISLNTKHVQK